MASTTVTTDRQFESSFWRSIRWQNGALAGLIVGSILFFVSRGMPWVSSGAINPSILGLEVAPGAGATPGFFFGVLALHLMACVLYGMLIGAVAHAFKPITAGFVGSLIGLVLYFVDSALFAAMFSSEIPQREMGAVLNHVVFGLITAETYKGMVRRGQPAPIL